MELCGWSSLLYLSIYYVRISINLSAILAFFSVVIIGIAKQAKPFLPAPVDFSFRLYAQISRESVLLEILHRGGFDVRFRFLFRVASFVLFLFVLLILPLGL